MYFTITTNKETADKIKRQCEFEEKHGWIRSYKLGDIRHETGLVSEYSIVQIKSRYEKIAPEDVFFLGLFCANQ